MKLSILLPCYNMASFVRRAVESCKLGAAAAELEIICVDDCSSDNTLEVLEEMAKENSNLKIIRHAENKRIMEARRSGIEEATGDYILFLDPDDRFEEGALDIIAESLKANPVDVLFFGARPYLEKSELGLDKTILKKIRGLTTTLVPPANCSSRRAFLDSIFMDHTYVFNIWGKAWKKDIVEKSLEFIPRGPFSVSEDITQCAIYLYFAKAIGAIGDICYLYSVDTGIVHNEVNAGLNTARRLKDLAMLLESIRNLAKTLGEDDEYRKYLDVFLNDCVQDFASYTKGYTGAMRKACDFEDFIPAEHLGLMALYQTEINRARKIMRTTHWFWKLYGFYLRLKSKFFRRKDIRRELKYKRKLIKDFCRGR